MNFKDKLLAAARTNNSWLCIGLDPDITLLPDCFAKDENSILGFTKAIIEATSDLVCAYKPNSAFFEAWGAKGWEILAEVVKAIPGNVPVILDFKRGDIGNTAKMYARAAFDMLGADAVTISPYLGSDSIEPFINYENKGIFILCLTSNPSSSELQKKIVLLNEPPVAEMVKPRSKERTSSDSFNISSIEMYKYVARLAGEWNRSDNIGLVVGATAPDELESVRREIGDGMPILIPGVGAQGGDLEKSVEMGSNSAGDMSIINISRGIIYAGKTDSFENDVRKMAESFRVRIATAREKKSSYYTGKS